MADESKTINLNDNRNKFHYKEQEGNRDFLRDPVVYGYWDAGKESSKRNSIDYWNDRADNLQDRPRRGGTHTLTDFDLAESIRGSQNDRGGFELRYIRGGIKPENIPTYHDLIREHMYRKAIREANGDKDKISAINNDYVRSEWNEYNRAKKDEIDSKGGSYSNWLRDTYGSDADPVLNWRPSPVEKQPAQVPAPFTQDNTAVKLHQIAENRIYRRNL